MACSNRGFMAHIVSMADVQEVNNLIIIFLNLFFPISRRCNNTFGCCPRRWHASGRRSARTHPFGVGPLGNEWYNNLQHFLIIYFLQADQFAVSVSFPVILPDGTFMGISSVRNFFKIKLI